MDISKASLAVAAALCVGAGAGGAYLATRGDAGPQREVAAVEQSGQGVEQSEGIVTEPASPIDDNAGVKTRERAEAGRADTGGAASRGGQAAPRRAAPLTRPRSSGPERAAAPVLESPVSRPTPAATEPPVIPAPQPVRVEPEPVAAPIASAPPAARFEELEIATDSVLGLQIETSLSSEEARVEDEVVARVTRDLRVGDRVAIPAGAQAQGEVALVERGGRLKDRARLGVRFTSIVLADGTRIPIDTETIYREGDAPSGESTAKIGGGAIGGAIIGGILGGAKGAILGGSAGAGAGTAAVLAGGRNPATLPSGTPVTVRITRPAVVTIER